MVGTSLYLDRPDSSLSAYAIWQVPKEGFYHFKLSCDDNGKVLIDNRSIISLIGISPKNVGEARQWLAPGPHFLELRLNNILGVGWLKIEVAGPGQANYTPLSTDELSFLELGNIETWLNVVFWGKIFSFLGFLGLGLLGLRFSFRQGAMISAKQESEKISVPRKTHSQFFSFMGESVLFSVSFRHLAIDLAFNNPAPGTPGQTPTSFGFKFSPTG